MIFAEGFECSVPSDDAVKGTVINCVGTAPDNYLVLGDVATWATAVFTLFLVIGAFMAWHKAKQTLDQMKADADDQREADRYREWIRAFEKYSISLGNICATFPNQTQIDQYNYARDFAYYQSFWVQSESAMVAVVSDFDRSFMEVLTAFTPANSERKPKFFEYKHLDKGQRIVQNQLGPLCIDWITQLGQWHNQHDHIHVVEKKMQLLVVRLGNLVDDPVEFERTDEWPA